MHHRVIFAVFASVIISSIYSAPNAVPKSECISKMDIVLVVDGSDSISSPDYEKQRKALAEMISEMEIRPHASRVGIVVYSTSIAEVVPLSGDKRALVEKAKILKHPRDGTVTDLGIKTMRGLFKKGRKNVPWVCIVITDGLSKYPDLTAAEAKKAKDMGINMFAVGISHLIVPAELESIATTPDQVLMLKSFDQLRVSLHGLMKVVCPCPMPPPVAAGLINNGSRAIGSVRSYMCEDGYQPMGNPNITCMKDSIWTTLEFKCEACAPPDLFYGNASVVDGLRLLGTHRQYRCKKGYTSPAPLVSICVTSPYGPSWTKPENICTACSDPPPFNNGYFDMTSTGSLVGTTRRYHCDKGYIPTGPIETTCVDDKGIPKWVLPKHGCKSCRPPPVKPFAVVDKKGNWLIGTVRTYACIPGYHPTGPMEVVCLGEQGAAFWKSTDHFCTACKEPPVLSNAVLQSNGTLLVGAVRTYECKPGFQPTGPIELMCVGKNGRTFWDGPVNKCIACLAPPIVPNSILDSRGNTLIGAIRRYECMDGYIQSGPIEVGCVPGTAEPLWTPAEFQCITCPAPLPVTHALLDYTGDNLVGSVRYYNCKQGYIPSVPGPITRQCVGEIDKKTGKGVAYWGKPSHYCKSCPAPPDMKFARLESLGDDLIGSQRSYVCTDGFHATGLIQIKCMPNGTWSNPDHSCTACGPVPDVTNAFINNGSHVLGTIRTYTCLPGYTPDRSPTIRCLKNAKWSPSNFTCIACPTPYGLNNAVLEPGDNLIGKVRRYTCLPGYLATGPITSTCALPPKMKRPDWSTPVHYCKDCGDPYPIKHARAVKGPKTVGAVQQYKCDKGFVPSAPPLSHCMANAEWTPPEFTCIVCGTPPILQHASVDTVGSTMVGSIRAYTCQNGYIATGPIEYVCEANPPESYPVPYWKSLGNTHCRDCGAPTNISSGYWIGGNTTIGSFALYMCDSGLVPSGPPEIVCNENGYWTPINFICTGCTVTPDIYNAIPISGVQAMYTTGSVITYECVSGYVAVGIPQMTCLKDATWSPKAFQCVQTCFEPPTYPHVSISKGGTLLGDVREYACKLGWLTVGNATVTCLATGQWSAKTFECQKCSPAPELPYAFPVSGDSLIGSEVLYQCRDGFMSDGPVISTCLLDLTWSEFSNPCYGCWTVPVIDNTLPLLNPQDMYPINATLTFECIPGHVPTATPTLICMKGGAWSPQQFNCALTCGEPPMYPEAILETGGSLVGDVRRYTCVSEFRTVGDASVTCLSSGVWSQRQFNCSTCSPASALEYAVPLPGGESFVGSMVAYECKPGLISDGPVLSMCQIDLTWSTPKHPCYDCGALPTVPNSYFTIGQTVIGAERRYHCEGGYDMSGDERIVCQPNGTWTQPKFTCYVRTTTTTTTPAPLKDDPSVCDGCRMLNGVGYIGHPYDCSQYVQCFYNAQGGIEAVFMPCPFGQYWNQKDLTCIPSDGVDCPTDRCLNPTMTHYKHSDSTKCCAYWSCVNGKSVAKCCGEGYRFDDEFGCVEDYTCTKSCPWHDELVACDKRPLLDKTRYEQHVGGNIWVKMPCATGTGFNPVDCGCTLNMKVVPGYACKPELLLDFDDGDTGDVSGRNLYILNEGVIPFRGAAYFNGKSRLIINRFSNTAFHGHLVIKMRYKEQLGGRTSNALQALITNGDCGDDPTIIVAKMPGYVLLGAKTDKPRSFALPTVDKEWKEVIYIHDAKKLEGKVCGASYSKYSWGPIQSTHCGVQIGYGTKLPNYVGLIDDVTLFQCRPDDSILSVYGGQRAALVVNPPPTMNVH